MNGAEALLDLYSNLGIEACFANPGTTELALVEALEAVPAIHPYLGLAESVVVGAADGYGRMAEKPAITILHLGPGFANGISNLHNARRANTPMITIVGDHATWHAEADAPLASDLVGMAEAASDWVGLIDTPRQVLALGMEAFQQAMAGNAATLVFPTDIQEAEAVAAPMGLAGVPDRPVAIVSESIVAALGRPNSALFLGGAALRGDNLHMAARIAAATGARLISETFAGRAERGKGAPPVERLPYFPEQAMACLEDLDAMVLVGAKAPVAFFGYEGLASSVVPDWTAVHALITEGDPTVALRALAVQVGVEPETPQPQIEAPEVPVGGLNPHSIGATIAAVQEPNTILVDEAATSGLPYFAASVGAPLFDHLMLTGGSLGYGLPAAVGAAIACPDRPVVAFVADGSSMYSIQALWTMQRYLLNVTIVLANNALYRILRVEADRSNMELGSVMESMTDIAGTEWVHLAQGMGVTGCTVSTAEELARALREARNITGPYFIEAQL